MNVDIITTVLNDFATFWKNIWNFLQPIFNMINGSWEPLKGLEGDDLKAAHLDNLNELSNTFGNKVEVADGYVPAEAAGDDN